MLLQGMWLKEIVGELRSLTSLKVPKDQVDPFMKIGADMVAFESKSVLHNKVLMARRPSRQANIANLLLQMIESKLKIGPIFHERPVAEIEFWDQLFVI